MSKRARYYKPSSTSSDSLTQPLSLRQQTLQHAFHSRISQNNGGRRYFRRQRASRIWYFWQFVHATKITVHCHRTNTCSKGFEGRVWFALWVKFSRSEGNPRKPRKPRKFCPTKISRHTVYSFGRESFMAGRMGLDSTTLHYPSVREKFSS